MNNFSDKVSFIWSVANLLRGPYHPNQYKDIMLPLVVLRRLDCTLEPTKAKVLQSIEHYKDTDLKNMEPMLNKITGYPFHNTSRFTFERLKADPDNIAPNLVQFILSFSSHAKTILEYFEFEKQIAKLEEHDLLYQVICKFAEIDLHPDTVSNIEMGYIFEELIRKFYDLSNEEAGDHFTPREVIRLMVDVLFLPDNDILTTRGIIKKLFDPTSGTGGMLSGADEYLHELNPDAHLEAYGQDYNPQSYAICGSDMMIKGQNLDNIYFGDSLSDDHFRDQKFDYQLANPPYGVEWKKQKDFVTREANEQGFGGRFGAGLPRISDGQLLFLQCMISKMKRPEDGGSRIGIVMNGSPLFTGGAGSGESEIRRWIIENDWLEAIIALPDQLFYNTGISTYLWFVTNRKSPQRKGKIQLINATGFYKKMRKSLGNKRNEITPEQKAEIVKIYGEFAEGEYCKIYDREFFGYQRITVERPLRLSFSVTDEHIARLKEHSAFKALVESKKRKDQAVISSETEVGRELQEDILDALENIQKTITAAHIATVSHEVSGIANPGTQQIANLCYNANPTSNVEQDADPAKTRAIPIKDMIGTGAFVSGIANPDTEQIANLCYNANPTPNVEQDADPAKTRAKPIKDRIGTGAFVSGIANPDTEQIANLCYNANPTPNVEQAADPAKTRAIPIKDRKGTGAFVSGIANPDTEQIANLCYCIKNRDQFTKLLKNALKHLSLSAPLFKAIMQCMAERDEPADICLDSKGNPEPDADLRDYENVPLGMDIDAYMRKEVLPHVPAAWVDKDKTKIGYELNFNRYFYKYIPPRPLEVIEAELKAIETEIAALLEVE